MGSVRLSTFLTPRQPVVMSKEAVLHAISALYHHNEADIRRQAEKWLETWRQGSEAWTVADTILHDSASPGEAHLFCAQTLRLKVGPSC